ncbi:MAG: cell division protein ZapA [candidate division FCPU426 bacterium]
MNEKNALRIKIFGIEYNLKGDSDPATMMELAQLVDLKMREIGQPGSAQTHRVAILAAFHLADELMKTRKALEAERQRFDHAARNAARLDIRLQAILNERDEAPKADGMMMMEEAQPDLLD